MTTFQDLNIIEPILKSLHEEGYTEPTPIQAQSIPVVLQGTDLLGCAQTGTGKTAAFAIPILQLLGENRNPASKRKIRSLILTPTRELAIQIDDSFKAYGRHTGLISTVVFGGVNQFSQTQVLKKGVDILIATPGRLLDLMNQGHISLRDLKIFVLDEADRMLDMGFIHDVKKVLASLPKIRQTLFFSATMPPEIVRLANSILHEPVRISVNPVSSTVDIIEQKIYFVDKVNKSALLVELLKDKNIKNALVFTRTKHGADKICRFLSKNKIQSESIHGNKSQNARQRALTLFKNHATRILVATEIAARGIDVEEMEYVINYDLPNVPEMYVHRIGRTGRAGAGGTAISFCDATEKPYLKDIEKLIAKKLTVVDDHPFPLTDHHPESSKPKQRVKESNSDVRRKSYGNQNNNNRSTGTKRGNHNRARGRYSD
jgi:ATP-dependent RNA helicase RhlE